MTPGSRTSQEQPLLEVDSISMEFKQPSSGYSVKACDDVSFTLRRSETLAIVGESGSGKTTLGRIVLGLLRPTSGRVMMHGSDFPPRKRSERQRMRARVQGVFQEPTEALDPRRSIRFQITEVLRHTGLMRPHEANAQAARLLALVGLPASLAAARPSALSVGMQQRVCIARAVASKPDLLVLDEPTSALPPETKLEIMELLGGLRAGFGMSQLLITHDLSLAQNHADRVIVMYHGQVVEASPGSEFFRCQHHPYSQALVNSILELAPSTPRRHFRKEIGLQPTPVHDDQANPGCHLAARCPLVTERCRTEPQELLPMPGGRLARCWRKEEKKG